MFTKLGKQSGWKRASSAACVLCAGLLSFNLAKAQSKTVDFSVSGTLHQSASGGSASASEPGSLSGNVLDRSGAAVPDASVQLHAEGSTQEVAGTTNQDGAYAFQGLKPGRYVVLVRRDGFEEWRGSMSVGVSILTEAPEILLRVNPAAAAVEVSASAHEVAEAQLQLEEKQRVLGVFPNFYASYAPNPEPLSKGQKFQLAARFATDPVAFAMTAVAASSEQRADVFPAYGRGMSGYAKRYGAAYTDGLTSTFFGQALLPAVLHQDPRYFVKGTGSKGARVLYAIASMVVCKGDNGRWQPNYSNVVGNLMSASLSNVYYPAASRGAGLVVGNAMTATAMGAVGGLFQEFLLHRMTPGVPEYGAVR